MTLVMLVATAISLLLMMIGERLLFLLKDALRDVFVFARETKLIRTFVLRLELPACGRFAGHFSACVGLCLSLPVHLTYLLRRTCGTFSWRLRAAGLGRLRASRTGLSSTSFKFRRGHFGSEFEVFLFFTFSHTLRLLKGLKGCKMILLRAVLFFFLGPHNLPNPYVDCLPNDPHPACQEVTYETP